MKSKLLKLFNIAIKASLCGVAMLSVFFTAIYAEKIDAQETESVRSVLLDVKLIDAKLPDAFEAIEKNTSFKIAYDRDDLNKDVRINFSKKKATVADLLMEISKTANLKFRQVNDLINVNIRDKEQKGEAIEVIIQGITITGKIISSENNEGLPGVNVVVKGTLKGSVTDVEGNYSLSVPDENTVLVFSSVGFITREIAVGSQSVIDIVMTTDVRSLSEVVVTALGIDRSKDELGYSVTEIDKFENTGVYNVANTLSGKVAGVQVSQVASGAGGSSKVIIRGNNSLVGNSQPLYVVDGIPINNESFGVAGRWGGY